MAVSCELQPPHKTHNSTHLNNGVVTGLPMVQEFPHPQVQSVDRTTVAIHSHLVVTTRQNTCVYMNHVYTVCMCGMYGSKIKNVKNCAKSSKSCHVHAPYCSLHYFHILDFCSWPSSPYDVQCTCIYTMWY